MVYPLTSCISAVISAQLLIFVCCATWSVGAFTPGRPSIPSGAALTVGTNRWGSVTLHSVSSNDGENKDEINENDSRKKSIGSDLRRAFLASTAAAVTYNVVGAIATPPGFKRIPTQFIAALGDPDLSSGTGAETWGLWPVDPGPRGVRLDRYDQLEMSGGTAPAGWTFDGSDWWLEEHGLIMETPNFPLEPGRYLVTGGRLVTTILSIFPPDDNGLMRWDLGAGKLYDVTHLPCRAARYRPREGEGGSPGTAKRSDFPVTPGAAMPEVQGCDKQDYAVLFVIGVEA
eukprot:CAMPEP_0183300858 /NCGR_PEP_ID=MMETSP0160_2-20130417/7146_1 /TAXON_ID=2839 ORGANISM="Odontella Sinensis, Strain Grunow 1884" /NCGR_SAMPLE_ID=MMETSP0160_2 /ASSEMBLY_ACC=CAM_ASM_000250 /LENGTH=286 /DNA_ID=CAMNT_0025463351 /DNA_START=55 /DNA_END=915 /DNA_ORIENTATION=+